MDFSCYLRKGIVYMPTPGKIHRGPYYDIEPVAVVTASDTMGFRRALLEVIDRGNPEVPIPSPEDVAKPLLPKYAGVKSYAAFANGAHLWGVWDHGGFYTIVPKKRMQPRGWVDDTDQAVTFPPDASIDDLCEKLIEMVQAKAAYP